MAQIIFEAKLPCLYTKTYNNKQLFSEVEVVDIY